ncbi:carboxylate--amine ligase [Ramlibacter sp. WS9]|uniref:ATP-binding protein n=1 Tax=Ramlibacter sp. WS9 TaxID=1882741 RepID=UPI001143E729|nr:carboxylate--amine ligase [Ramlibacter sp. WS9]ROZ77500.1 carboxylate--amine ligase [Ramlibacter sp. WS9]
MRQSETGTGFFQDRGLAISFRFVSLPDLDLNRLDQWLGQALEIHVDPEHQASKASEDAQRNRATAYARRCLTLAGKLLQMGNVPVFDCPQMRSLSPVDGRSGEWEAKADFSKVDHVPHACYGLALQFALELCRWAAGAAITHENRNNLYAALEQKFKVPVKRMVPSGKSTIPVLRVAHQLGIPFIHLGSGIYQLGWGSKARRMDRSTTELDSAMGSKLARNKVAAANLLRAAGLPAPVHYVAENFELALSGARSLGWPVVVKPTDRERGEGVAVDIADEAMLKTAFEAARKLSNSGQVIIERQVQGVCHRLFIADGRLLYAVKRLPMCVTGDGRHTVAELVDIEVQLQLAKPPWVRSAIRPVDELAIATIRAAGWDISSVPPAGALVPLRRIESTQWGGVDEEMTGRVHPENVSMALRAAELFGLHVAGIDIITPEIEEPWHQNGAIINEVNFAPLLGGGEISRRHIPVFLRDFLDGDGRIPMEGFQGGESGLQMALNRQQELIERGMRCYFTTSTRTLDAKGKERILPFQNLDQRTAALLLSPEVDAIVVLRDADPAAPETA